MPGPTFKVYLRNPPLLGEWSNFALSGIYVTRQTATTMADNGGQWRTMADNGGQWRTMSDNVGVYKTS